MGQGDSGRQDSADLISSHIQRRPGSLRWSVQNRIGTVIRAYDEQGFHRTGTEVDRRSGDWLANGVRQLGFEPVLEEFSLSRVAPLLASVKVDRREIQELPIFAG